MRVVRDFMAINAIFHDVEKVLAQLVKSIWLL